MIIRLQLELGLMRSFAISHLLLLIIISAIGKLLRASKYEEEISDGHLGINEKELNSMNKHIPGMLETSLSLYSGSLLYS